MSDLIQALRIFLKYGDPKYPTHCGHDELIIWGIDPDDVSSDDKKKLDELGFFVADDKEHFISYRFGAA